MEASEGEPEVNRLKRLLPALLIAIAVACPVHGEEKDTFYLKATAGYSLPMLSALSDELELQDLGEKLGNGPCFDVALGRALFGRGWALEVSASKAFYSSFHYMNDLEDFEGEMSHSGFYAVILKRFPLRENSIVPSAGLGIGYGRTELISGGGKMSAFEGIVLARLEARIRGNIGTLLECAYTAGLAGDTFDAPHLENVSGDNVFASDGLPIEDRFSSLEFKMGIIVYLPTRIPSGDR
jgi:hypothetical protein